MAMSTEEKQVIAVIGAGASYGVSTAICAVVENILCKSTGVGVFVDGAALLTALPVVGYVSSYIGSNVLGSFGSLIDATRHGKQALKKPDRVSGNLLLPQYANLKKYGMHTFKQNFAQIGSMIGLATSCTAALFYVPTKMNELRFEGLSSDNAKLEYKLDKPPANSLIEDNKLFITSKPNAEVLKLPMISNKLAYLAGEQFC